MPQKFRFRFLSIERAAARNADDGTSAGSKLLLDLLRFYTEVSARVETETLILNLFEG